MNLNNLFDTMREEIEDEIIYDSHILTFYARRSRAHATLIPWKYENPRIAYNERHRNN